MNLIKTTLGLALIAAVSTGAWAAKLSAKSKYDGVEIKVITDRTSDGLMQPLFGRSSATPGSRSTRFSSTRDWWRASKAGPPRPT